jgi:hypothetical protein
VGVGRRGVGGLEEKMGHAGKKKRRGKERWAGGRLGRASYWAAGWKEREGEREERMGGFCFLFLNLFKFIFSNFKFKLFFNFSNFQNILKLHSNKQKHHAFKL